MKQIELIGISMAAFITAFDNDNDAVVPEVWAQEALIILENTMVFGNMVHRDYEDKIAEYGDVVNCHRPSSFTSKRKTDTDNVSTQDASTTNVRVPLNQWLHVSFIIKDGELSKGFVNLLNLYLRPALIAQAEAIDQILAAQVYQFLPNAIGKLGTDITKDTIIAAREKANDLKWPASGRNLVLTSASEADALSDDDLVKANEVADNGAAIQEAYLGRRLGFSHFMAQNTAHVVAGNATSTGAINGALAAGATTLVVDGFAAQSTTAGVTAGEWITIAGDGTPQFVVSTNAATATSIVVSPGLRFAVADNAVITCYKAGAINGALATAWAKDLVIDGMNSVAPKRGQLISIGTGGTELYGAMGTPTTTALMLDRPLDSAAADNAVLGIGPAGNYNFAFNRNALALVNRPLAMPISGMGVRSYTAVYNGLAVRVVISYDPVAQGHRVTIDNLAGVAVLDENLGIPVLG